MSPELEAEVLLRHALGVGRADLFLRWDSALAAEAWSRYRELLEARSSGVPAAYLVGSREFMSLSFAVDPRVLIPRPETELLVEFLIERLRDHASPLVADVGTGSGAIAVSLAVYLPRTRLVATDVSAGALEVARANAVRHGVAGRVTFLVGDVLSPLLPAHRSRLDAIAANPPYVPEAEAASLPREIIAHEPRMAVVGGVTGIEAHRRIIAGAPALLRPGGWVVLEVAAQWDQARLVAAALKEAGAFREIQIHRDLDGRERMVAARAGERE